ncbi:urease accessory protein UreE [Alginatibacterium sediminis]|uniref:Urease accessory protein UreE n=1 Tax=Alginatibacterium sediminis TaxID=2164068 RepID=A0A420E5Q8_9ALTE|nr:urease accessory protein UreE [Alginatibacterium sediminis]RKF12790.1 urease accessory protein UreE [Alginatibacterium sediminis]
MIELTTIIERSDAQNLQTTACLSLPINARIKSRIKVELDSGESAGLFLPRGKVLRDGDVLANEAGLHVLIKAADEQVSTVHCADAHLLSRACYHLGNRHVPLQIEANWVRYQHDHVLDAMLRDLGLSVDVAMHPFEPEPGAYGGSSAGGHSHHH